MEQPDRIGRYEVKERVGRGGMGVLYRGRDPVLEREVAIKVMSGDFSADESARARFFREARAAARLQHRNIVTIYEFAEDHGTPYIAMEFLRGTSLAVRLTREPPLTLVQKLDIVTQLCTGLHYAHEQGIVHRDVKPGNIWVMDDGTIKLLDFGIAKVAASTMTHSGSVLGSAAYMAPEQVAGREIDGRADVFAAGVVLYELLAGRKPFEGEAPTAVMMKIVKEDPPPLRQFAPDVPAALVNAVNKALQKDPDRRFMHAGDFGAELRLIRLSLERTTETLLGDAADVAQTMYVPASSDSAGLAALALDPAAGASLEGSGARPAPAAQTPGRFSTWVAVAALAVSAVLATIVMLQRSGAAPADLPAGAASASTGSANTPAVPPASATSQEVVKLVSDPAGAVIRIGGEDTGLVTPADVAVADLAEGRVQLTKQGYRDATVRAQDEQIRDRVVRARLEPVPSGLAVSLTGSYPFEVAQGGTVVSQSSVRHQFSLPEGGTLRLRNPDYLLDLPLRAEAASGRFNYTLPAAGRLSVRGMEHCEIWMGGRNLGFPPIAERPIAPGTHRLEVRCPDGSRTARTVTIAAGQAATEVLR